MSLGAKSFDFDVFGSANFQIEDFNILGHDFRMLKALDSKLFDSKTSNSKLLTFWGHVPGC